MRISCSSWLVSNCLVDGVLEAGDHGPLTGSSLMANHGEELDQCGREAQEQWTKKSESHNISHSLRFDTVRQTIL